MTTRAWLLIAWLGALTIWNLHLHKRLIENERMDDEIADACGMLDD